MTRIVELESELATVRRASELFAEGRGAPKALFGIVETLAREGHGTKRVCRLCACAVGILPLAQHATVGSGDPAGVAHRCDPRDPRTVASHLRVAARSAELDDVYGQRVDKKLIQSIMRELGIAGLPARRQGQTESDQPRDHG